MQIFFSLLGSTGEARQRSCRAFQEINSTTRFVAPKKQQRPWSRCAEGRKCCCAAPKQKKIQKTFLHCLRFFVIQGYSDLPHDSSLILAHWGPVAVGSIQSKSCDSINPDFSGIWIGAQLETAGDGAAPGTSCLTH